jgi:mono/diheme cytochrome c family protein
MTSDDVHERADVRSSGRATRILALVLLTAVASAADRSRDADAAPTGWRAAGAPMADTVTPATIALGERIFQGKVGGALCATCHGKDAKGVTGLGPDLTDSIWLHGDGSMEFLQNIIRTGVMTPKQGGGVMPPYGGATLKPDQLEAVAAYVYSLSHPTGG